MTNEKTGPDDEGLNIGMPIRSEEIGFSPEDLLECGKCLRKNSPTRLRCIYCGGGLEVPEERLASVRPGLRRPEEFGRGFSLIYLGAVGGMSPGSAAAAAELLRLDEEFILSVAGAARPLPLIRLESEAEARIVAGRLLEAGVETALASDGELGDGAPPRRLRRLEFSGETLQLIVFANDEVIELSPADLRLIVTGTIYRRTVESAENRKKGESRLVRATETSTEEQLIDLYAGEDRTGYRVSSQGFDFSCLGPEKAVITGENVRRLKARLSGFAPSAKAVDDYPELRLLLGGVWQVEERTDAQGLTRSEFGKLAIGRTATTGNLLQFTRFSRLQRHLL